MSALAAKVVEECRALAAFSEEPGRITRRFLSPPCRLVHARLEKWMLTLGMKPWVDAIGNLRAVYPAATANAPRLIVGSHTDTVPNAGAFDGVLGVVIGLALIESLNGEKLPFEIEIVAFSEEEGVRFSVPFLGSLALVGQLDETVLTREDAAGISIANAVRDYGLSPTDLSKALFATNTVAYLEIHIEQGPLLEYLNLPLGVVSAVAGQTRCEFTWKGHANHAGTTPMHLRKDALAAAAVWIVELEAFARDTEGLVATVGRINAEPGVGNVVPGELHHTLDLRHQHDSVRLGAQKYLLERAQQIAQKRGITLTIKERMNQSAIPMNEELQALLTEAIFEAGYRPKTLASGAGHDAMVIAPYLPSAMLFLRSPGGLSHHPEESVSEEDIDAALRAGQCFFTLLANHELIQGGCTA